jgi:hypothetical protein
LLRGELSAPARLDDSSNLREVIQREQEGMLVVTLLAEG